MICTRCGAEIDSESRFCEMCGQEVKFSGSEGTAGTQYIVPVGMPEEEEKTEAVPVQTVPSVNDLLSQAKKIGTAVSGKADAAVTAIQKQAFETRPAARRAENEGVVSTRYSGQNYMSDRNMWSWLKRDSKRQQFFSETLSEETEESYMAALQKKLDENLVPAKIERKEVFWDNSSIKQDVFRVVPDTKVVNPVAYLIQFNQVGKFSYVEEKTFIIPPDLPKEPGKFVHETDNTQSVRVFGAVGVAALVLAFVIRGVFLLAGVIIGAIFLFLAFTAATSGNEAKAHNERVRKEIEAWNSAWNNWETSIFAHSFQEDINGRLSRIYDSVFGCIKQVNEEMFGDNAVNEEKESTSMTELRALISEKKKEYK